MPAIRLFNCRCNHRLRYGQRVCSYCFERTPLKNRLGFAVALFALFPLGYAYLAPEQPQEQVAIGADIVQAQAD